MSKRVSQLSTLSAAALDDTIPILDESAGVLKRISVQNLVGYVDFGWTASGESWSYSAWNSTLKRGTITVPSDATTKYTAGMFVRFSQSTGGTKYGKIISVTSTTLVVYMGSYTLNNEAISSPVYSPLQTPYGLPLKIRDHVPYKFRVYRSAAYSAPNASRFAFDTASFDSNGDVDIVTNEGKFVAPFDGTYSFYTLVTFSINAQANTGFGVSIYKNGVSVAGSNIIANMYTGLYQIGSNSRVTLDLVAGDYVEVYSDISPNNNPMVVGADTCYFEGEYKGS